MVFPAPDAAKHLTVEEFLSLRGLPEGKAELVRGEVRVTPPPGAPHGFAASSLLILVANYARSHGLGRAFGDAFGYELVQLPRTVRVPDASFVRAEMLPKDGVRPGLLKFAA